MAIKKDVKENNEFRKFLELNSLLKIVSILFILSITILAIVNIFEKNEGDKKNQNTIVVSGHSELNVSPDTTKFTISVVEDGKDIKSSQDAATNKINSAIIILKQNGVLDKNIKTLNYTTYPKYSSRTVSCAVTGATTPSAVSVPVSVSAVAPLVKSKAVVAVAPSLGAVKTSAGVASSPCVDKTSEIVGYETNQSIEVKITDIVKNPSLAGVLVSAVGKVGVQTGDLTSYVENLDFTKSAVRDQSIQKAKIQADDIAESLGVKLGKITSFSENSGGGYAYPVMMSAKAVGSNDVASASLPVGENTITSDVSVTYSIR